MQISAIASGLSTNRIYPMSPASGLGSVDKVDSVSQIASIGMLKKSLDVQSQAALKLLASLPAVQDPDLGQHVDTYA
jgi:hypothetical protein